MDVLQADLAGQAVWRCMGPRKNDSATSFMADSQSAAPPEPLMSWDLDKLSSRGPGIPFREFFLCASAPLREIVICFLGVESVWPEKNIFRKFAKIAEKKKPWQGT